MFFLNHFSFLLLSHQSFFVFFTKVFFIFPPHPLSLTFYFIYPCYLPDLLQPASLLCLFVLCVASVVLWSYGWVGLKGKVCVSVSHTHSLSTIPGHRQSRQAKSNRKTGTWLRLWKIKQGRGYISMVRENQGSTEPFNWSIINLSIFITSKVYLIARSDYILLP